ncbi:MAG: hypothetical protein DI536_08360 [Archangium gephyra]|uniref:Uncharacterized protein n=1 Tax=Archangium gephyra TaxID=48 RepID=A0A2W5TLA4_9BACT|nr:MAG: hypothetical protein DI536_08360 [Archangium gephyra]
MRWLVWFVVISESAFASSVLLVPADDKSRPAAEAMVETISAEKLVAKMAPAGSPAVKCLATPETRDTCLAVMEEKAKVTGIFIVNAAMKGAKGTVTIELFANGAVVKKETAKVAKAKLKKDLKKPVLSLLKAIPADQPAPVIAAAVTPVVVDTPTAEPAPVVDEPKKEAPVLTPKTEAAPVAAVDVKTEVPPAPKPKVAAWVMTGVTAAAIGVGATFGALGMTKRSQLERAPDGVSPYSYSQALALQQEANRDLTIATGVGIGAGVSFVVTAILWGVE